MKSMELTIVGINPADHASWNGAEILSRISITGTTAEILRDTVWRWCLEKELGIENEAGELVGEVTEKPRTGFRASLQGCPLDDPKYYSIDRASDSISGLAMSIKRWRGVSKRISRNWYPPISGISPPIRMPSGG